MPIKSTTYMYYALREVLTTTSDLIKIFFSSKKLTKSEVMKG